MFVYTFVYLIKRVRSLEGGRWWEMSQHLGGTIFVKNEAILLKNLCRKQVVSLRKKVENARILNKILLIFFGFHRLPFILLPRNINSHFSRHDFLNHSPLFTISNLTAQVASPHSDPFPSGIFHPLTVSSITQ